MTMHNRDARAVARNRTFREHGGATALANSFPTSESAAAYIRLCAALDLR